MLTRTVQALAFGAAAALLGMLAGTVPGVLRLEENTGLGALFQLRGPRPAPPEVVVVSLDKVSSDAFGLPNEPDKWPRTLHADLVDRLAAAGATVIAFDVLFDDPDEPDDDQRLGAAIGAAGNVVMTAYLDKAEVGGSRDGQVTVTTESLVPPIPAVTASALAVAPFLLPVVPVTVSQFWTYKASAGNLPTLPTVVFQAWMLRQSGGWLDDLRAACPDIRTGLPARMTDVWRVRRVADLASLARTCLAADEAAARSIQRRWGLRLRTGTDLPQGALRSLFEVYWGPDTRYLNFYGPPRTVITVPYSKALRGGSLDMAGKIVLVGFSEQFQPEQKDGFHTVYTDENGLDLSGVEIAATAVANLVDGTAVKPLTLGPQILVIGLWGFLVGAFCRILAPLAAVAFALVAIPLYGLWALWVFDATNNWLPVVTPLAIQLPAALLLGILAQYRQTQLQRQRVIDAIGGFVPPAAVDRLMEDLGRVEANAEVFHGTCLATDVEHYTTLAETLDPESLAALMNEYYTVLDAEVEAAGGIVLDVTGDSMLAIWAAARPDRALGSRACRGALGIAAAVSRFNAQPGHHPLPTRIGLHSGPVRLGNLGGARHKQYRATGDIVNTASRIDGLNKLLGTRILASGETLAGVEGLVTREVGTFLLAGKSTPLVVHELTGTPEQVTPAVRAAHARFAGALKDFRDGDWPAAAAGFAAVLASLPGDGPARYYVALCAHCLTVGPDDVQNGVVRITGK
jgi:adenylate cyclase